MTYTVVKCRTMEEIKPLISQMNMQEFYNQRKLLIWEESFAGQEAELLDVIVKPGRRNLYVIKSKYHICETVPKAWLQDAWDQEEPFQYMEKDPIDFKRRMHPETPMTQMMGTEDFSKLQSQLQMLSLLGGNNGQQDPTQIINKLTDVLGSSN